MGNSRIRAFLKSVLVAPEVRRAPQVRPRVCKYV